MESVAISARRFLTFPCPLPSLCRLKRLHSQSQSQSQSQAWCRFKHSDFQDFRDYAKPARLLQPAEPKLITADTSAEKLLPCFRNGESRSLYKVVLGTSNFSASSLSDSSAGVALCLIDENGDSILQRIPSSLAGHHSADSDEELPRFQRGSVDEFSFEGPKLGRVEAFWIGVESGQWRLGRVGLTVIHGCQQSLEEKDRDELKYTGFRYEFEAEDILLGEGTNVSMLELRPYRVTELSGVDASTLFTRCLLEPTSFADQCVSNEESMREYADLKLSLLLYNAVLICIGTLAASFSAGERAALAFLTGGVVGFLYLLLLQRSVDGISAAESSFENTGGTEQTFGFGGFKGPISSLALAFGFALFSVKYGSEDLPMVLTPKELIAGMMGFLACKVAVVLAAFRPLANGLKINE